MIVAGIDEAGYGPLLGPLVVGCCAFEVPASADTADPPCLWTLLRGVVSKKRVRSGRKLHVNDSKLVYSPAQGLRELERATLGFAFAGDAAFPDSIDALLLRAAPALAAELNGYPWYRRDDGERFPLAQDAMSVRLMVNALRNELNRTGLRCPYFRAHVLLERELNRRFAQTRNKASVLFGAAAQHLDHLLRHHGHEGLLVVCDRQGGREHYGRLLRLMFEEWALEIVAESEARAEYVLRRDGHAARVIFVEKAEGRCMSVALASMLCKYMRECLMHRFNAYWQSLLPDLTPTAGYYLDGQRFLRDIDGKRREIGVADHQLIRSR